MIVGKPASVCGYGLCLPVCTVRGISLVSPGRRCFSFCLHTPGLRLHDESYFSDTGSAFARRQLLACSLANVTQLRPAGVHGWHQVAAIETAVSETDIIASSTCNFNIITLVHMEMLKNNAIVGNIGHFDNEIEFADSEGLEGMKVATLSLRSVFRPTRTTSPSCTPRGALLLKSFACFPFSSVFLKLATKEKRKYTTGQCKTINV